MFSLLHKIFAPIWWHCLLIHFHYFMFYVHLHSWYFKSIQAKTNFIFAFQNLWIKTETYVQFFHCLIHKTTKIFGHFWWLNLCTDFDETKGLFSYCVVSVITMLLGLFTTDFIIVFYITLNSTIINVCIAIGIAHC